MELVPISKDYVRAVLERQGVVCVTGVYGSGKGLIVNWLAGELAKEGNKVVRVSYKDLPTPTAEDIPLVVGYKNYLQLQAGWRRLAEGQKRRGKKLILVIEEVQQALPNGEDFWRTLESLHYYQKESIRIVTSAQPAIIGFTNVHWKALSRNAVVYPLRLTREEIDKMVGESPYLSAIVRLSHGHYGTVKYLIKLLEVNKFKGKILTEVQAVKWAKEEGMVDQFAEIIWGGLSAPQRQVIKQLAARWGRISNSKVVNELIDCGMLWRGGKRLHFYADWLLPFVREYISRLPPEKKINQEELANWGMKERRLVTALMTQAGKTVSYVELADMIWEEENEEYSLWALSRLASRVKNKLEEMGYGGSIINERGRGYKWLG